MRDSITTEAAKLIGSKGGKAKTERKQRASRANGKWGGRPRNDGRRVCYRISWKMNDSEGVFPQRFTSRKIAMKVARAWREEMMDLDPDKDTVRARYKWNITEEDAS